MAAGMGSRYGGLKQVEGFGPAGETLLEYSVYDALKAGFTQATFIIRKEMEDIFRQSIVSRFQGKIDVKLVFQENELSADDAALAGGQPNRKKPWGTGHAMMTGLAVQEGPFLVMNADDFYGASAFASAAAFFQSIQGVSGEYGIVGYEIIRTLSPNGAVSRGVLACDANGFLEGIKEHHGVERKTEGVQFLDSETEMKYILGKRTLVSMNLLALTPEISAVAKAAWRQFLQKDGLREGSEFGVPDILEAVIKMGMGKIHVVPTEADWMGVTHPDDAPSVRQGLLNLDYPSPLWS